MFIKSSKVMQLFFTNLYTDMLGITGDLRPDDQRDLNLQLFRSGLKYHGNVILNSNSTNFGVFHYREYSVRIALLSHSSYRRHCKNVPSDILLNSTVLHCHLPKSYLAKKQGMEKYGLFNITS